MDLTLATREVDGRAIVAVGGEIDVYTAPKLRDQITELVGDGAYNLVIDLEAVEFLDSTGLGVLVGGLKKVRAHDGSLELDLQPGAAAQDLPHHRSGEGVRDPRVRRVAIAVGHPALTASPRRSVCPRITRSSRDL